MYQGKKNGMASDGHHHFESPEQELLQECVKTTCCLFECRLLTDRTLIHLYTRTTIDCTGPRPSSGKRSATRSTHRKLLMFCANSFRELMSTSTHSLVTPRMCVSSRTLHNGCRICCGCLVWVKARRLSLGGVRLTPRALAQTYVSFIVKL